MRQLRGVPASPGVASGPWVHVEPTPAPAGGTIEAGDAEREVDRLHAAAETAAIELEAIASGVREGGHAAEAEIFSAQAEMARDPALEALAAERIRTHAEDAIAGVQAAAGSFAEQLRSLGDELLAARAADVLDVGERIARILAGAASAGRVALPAPAIVVADDLPPSVTATLPRDRLLGLALESSSPTAHAAILARAYGIPAVVGAQGLVAALRDDGPAAVDVAIDGQTGEIFIDPDPQTRRRLQTRAGEAHRRHERDLVEADLPAVTLDGVEVALLANIGTPEESGPAVELGARGVGLFRTEFLFLERSAPPSESEQLEAYRRAVESFAPHPVTVRLLDVGGDKPIPYLKLPQETNPFLGVRALRLAEERPELFLTQLRACYRAAAAGPLKVMAPMVADARDAETLLALAGRARDSLAEEGLEAGPVALGVMLEIPSAVLVADSYFPRLAFASLGTNDLLQYALAVDRGNPALERYRDSLHPAVLRLVRMAVESASRSGIELSVCGEMAGDPVAALALAGLGIRSLSMAASSLPAVRRALRASRLADLEAAASAALDEPSAERARGRFAPLTQVGEVA
jgi:phosphoenolpyruvate-protein phosphotransferase